MASIASISDHTDSLQSYCIRPFRNPHHSASSVAMVGGGSHPRPGEISQAHCGVLFLDELPEFQRNVLEVLREPMESGEILICRAKQHMIFPARFQLIAAMNPCPCGYYGDPQRHCRCSPDRIRRYRDEISGPLLDRIDLQINVNRIPARILQHNDKTAESSAVIRQRVCNARQLQYQQRQQLNAELQGKDLEKFCPLLTKDQVFLEQAANNLQLSPRAYFRILRVARTIADLAGNANIERKHLSEAINYRALDREQL